MKIYNSLDKPNRFFVFVIIARHNGTTLKKLGQYNKAFNLNCHYNILKRLKVFAKSYNIPVGNIIIDDDLRNLWNSYRDVRHLIDDNDEPF